MGMARSAAADQQLPYIVSGGMGGVGLITFGVGVLLVAQIRTERQRMMTVLEVFAIGLSRATEGGSISVEEGAAGEPPPGTLVVAGSSTFHRPDCRLIQGKAGLDRLTLGVAQSSGLSPCRVCDPLGTSSADTDVTDRIGTIPPSPGPPLEEPTTNQLGAEQAPLGSDEGTR
jgi:hypothetical protein